MSVFLFEVDATDRVKKIASQLAACATLPVTYGNRLGKTWTARGTETSGATLSRPTLFVIHSTEWTRFVEVCAHFGWVVPGLQRSDPARSLWLYNAGQDRTKPTDVVACEWIVEPVSASGLSAAAIRDLLGENYVGLGADTQTFLRCVLALSAGYLVHLACRGQINVEDADELGQACRTIGLTKDSVAELTSQWGQPSLGPDYWRTLSGDSTAATQGRSPSESGAQLSHVVGELRNRVPGVWLLIEELRKIPDAGSLPVRVVTQALLAARVEVP